MNSLHKQDSGVYVIRNTVSGKEYVGSSVDVLRREREHWLQLRKGKHANIKLQRSFYKHGEQSFMFQVICFCEKGDVLRIEQEHMDLRRPFYNVCRTAGNSTGRKTTEATKRKIGVALKGLRLGTHHSAHTKALIGAASRVRMATPETKAIMAAVRKRQKGRIMSPTARAHMSESHKKRPVTGVHVQTGATQMYPSTSAARRDGFNPGNVHNCCTGRAKTYGGYRWCFSAPTLNTQVLL